MLRSFTKTDDWPQRAAEGAAAADTATEQPLHVDRQSLLEHAVDAVHRGLVLLRGHAGLQAGGELACEAVA